MNPFDINIKNLTKQELKNLLGYSLFGLDPSQIKENNNRSNIINTTIDSIEKVLEYKFIENNRETDRYLYRCWGTNFINFNFRPVCLQIPLRLIINIIHFYFRLILRFRFVTCSKTKISYLYKISDPNKKTIFFIHGFGFGYIPYTKTLLQLQKNYNLIIMIIPNISSYRYYEDLTCTYFPSTQDITNSVFDFIKTNNINDCMVLAHSFGTYITQILSNDSKSSIFSKIILVDPIIFWIGCFKMSLHVENPFVRKSPIYYYLLDNLINYLIYQCIYLKFVCYRLMFGPDFWIYDDSELGSNVTIVLEKGDYVIPSELLYSKIKSKVKCIYIDDPDALHGSFILESKYYSKLVELLE